MRIKVMEILDFITLILIVLKLLNLLDVSWWIVFTPVFAHVAISVIIAIMFYATENLEKRKIK